MGRRGSFVLAICLYFSLCFTATAADVLEVAFDGADTVPFANGETGRSGYHLVLSNPSDSSAVSFCAFEIGIAVENAHIVDVEFQESDAYLVGSSDFVRGVEIQQQADGSVAAIAGSLGTECVEVPAGSAIWLARIELEFTGDRTGSARLRHQDGLSFSRGSFRGAVLNQVSGPEGEFVVNFSQKQIGLGNQRSFLRADFNEDGRVNISDSIGTFAFIFLGEARTSCLKSVDTNDDGHINVADPMLILNFEFRGGSEPAPPFPGCGVDPTVDALSCDVSELCSPSFENQATLSWSAPDTNDDGSPIENLAGYRIFYGVVSRRVAPYSHMIDVGPATGHSIASLPSRGFYFAVKAYNKFNIESDFSSEVFKADRP